MSFTTSNPRGTEHPCTLESAAPAFSDRVRRDRRTQGIACGLAGFLLAGLLAPVAARTAELSFSKDIRPILSDKCYACHGPDANKRKAGLRLDTEEGATAALASREGSFAIVPGNPEASTVLIRAMHKDPDEVMPPASFNKPVTPEEIATLQAWITAGAPWQQHWAYVAPVAAELPAIQHIGWPRQAMDHFVLHRMEAEGLAPSPEADRRTLARRLALDLTGLPLPPEAVERFVNDDRPDAYERLVDQLLASERYGEHMARYWLDAARYGDTHGLHLDNYRSIWPYRDWVIRAFQENLSFDQFTIEQLAGDLMPDPTLAQRVATGFNRCNVTTSEGGAINEEFYMRYAVDRASTTATVWMGATAGCAVCHDHKYDPFSQKEFYRLYAYFNNVAEAAMDGNKAAVPPVVKVPVPGQQDVLEEIDAKLSAWADGLESRESDPANFVTWAAGQRLNDAQRARAGEDLAAYFAFNEAGNQVVNTADGAKTGIKGGALRLPGREGGALVFRNERFIELAKLGDVEKDQAFSYGAWVFLRSKHTGTILSRMDDKGNHRGYDLYLHEGRPFVHLLHKWPDNGIRVDATPALPEQRWAHVFATYDGSGKAAGVTIYIDGQPVETTTAHDSLTETIKTGKAFRIGRRTPSAPLKDTVLDELRLYTRALSGDEVRAVMHLPVDTLLAASEVPQKSQALQIAFLESQGDETRTLAQEGTNLHTQRKAEEERMVTTLVMQEKSPRRKAFVMERGEYDKPGEEVQPGVPAIFPALPADAPPNRLGLARWLVSREHPLTARVTVNRFWQQLFGAGIVRTTEDFGLQGEFPTHPALLDWLAVDFMDHGWDVKRLLKTLVLSAAYRQSSRVDADLLARDPDNRLLARGPRFRLDAETVRDQALALSGLLVDTVGGPSVKPYQPPGLWKVVAYPKSDTATFVADQGDKVYRRSLYTFWKRTSPPPTMSLLDAPSRENCTVRRNRTNTPLQALALMNDTQYVEAARAFGTRTLQEGGATDTEQLQFLFTAATARQPEARESEILTDSLQTFRQRFRDRPDDAAALINTGNSTLPDGLDPANLAAWTMVAGQVLNLDEVLNKN